MLFIAFLALPLLGALFMWVGGSHIRPRAALAFGLATALLSVFLWPMVGHPDSPSWLLVDGLGYPISVVSSVLGFAVLVYSLGYMGHGDDTRQYYGLVLAAIGCTNGIVLSGNLLLMAGFWITCSYLTYRLVGYEETTKASAGAKKALGYSRLGDAVLLFALGILYHRGGGQGFGLEAILAGEPSGSSVLLSVAGFGFLLSAACRSAQIPLHGWLPGAMEAPAPASALLDAATVMNAGVYLLMRFQPLFAKVPGWLVAVRSVGAVTILLSAIMAFCSRDLKKMLAYSTMSQLGFMFLALGSGSLLGAHFHMLSHAVLKSLLFLAAGSLIHGTGTRNMEEIGGAAHTMPSTSRAFLLGVMGLSGTPLMSGFFSKDLILEALIHQKEWVALALGGLGALFTAAYSWSAYVSLFWGKLSDKAKRASESPRSMLVPMRVLAVIVVFGWLFVGMESAVLGSGVHVVPPEELFTETFRGAAIRISLLALVGGLGVMRARRSILSWVDRHVPGFLGVSR